MKYNVYNVREFVPGETLLLDESSDLLFIS